MALGARGRSRVVSCGYARNPRVAACGLLLPIRLGVLLVRSFLVRRLLLLLLVLLRVVLLVGRCRVLLRGFVLVLPRHALLLRWVLVRRSVLCVSTRLCWELPRGRILQLLLPLVRHTLLLGRLALVVVGHAWLLELLLAGVVGEGRPREGPAVLAAAAATEGEVEGSPCT